MSYIQFDICGCFDVPVFELSRFYSIAATSKKVKTAYLLLARTCQNYYFYSDDFWLKLDVCETGR